MRLRIVRYRMAWLFCLLSAPAMMQGQETAAFTDPAKDYKEALDIFEQRKYNIAFDLFTDFIEEYQELVPGASRLLLADAHYYRAYCAAEREDPKALDHYQAYLKEWKGHSLNNTAYFDIGRMYFRNKDHSAALPYFDRVNARALDGSLYEEFVFKRGYCYHSKADHVMAMLVWVELVNMAGSAYYHDVNYYYGLSALETDNRERALEAFRAAEGHPRYRDEVPVMVCRIYWENAQYRPLVDYATSKLDRPQLSERPTILRLIGQSYMRLEEYEPAAEYLGQYVEVARKVDEEDHYQLGYAQYRSGEIKKAVTSFRKLSHLDSELAQNALYLSADASLQAGDKENARTALQRAAAMPYDAVIEEEASFNYGKLSHELGFHNDALLAMRKFLEAYPASSFREEASGILAELLLQTRNYDEALAVIEDVKDPSMRLQQAYQLMAYHKAVALYNDGSLNSALDALKTSLRYTPDEKVEALTYYWIGDIRHRRGEFEVSMEAVEVFLASAAVPEPGDESGVNRAAGLYLQAYNHYKLEAYAMAASAFTTASELLEQGQPGPQRELLLPDVLLRTADCHFLLRNYAAAVRYYDRVIGQRLDGADYAQYQKAIVKGVTGDPEAKIRLLQSVLDGSPGSVLADDALYEMATTHLQMEQYELAIKRFRALIGGYENSEWVPAAHLGLGLVYYNRDDLQLALDEYKKVVDRYPNTAYTREALLAIRDVYVTMGDPEGYIRYLDQVPGVNITASEQDSLLYQAAENHFTTGDHDKALSGFNDYLLRFPAGFFQLPARFYRGECLFSFEDYNAALADYEAVIGAGSSRFLERSLQRASRINYHHMEDVETAMEQYTALGRQATTDDNRRLADMGMLRCGFHLADYETVLSLSAKVISQGGLTGIQHAEVHFYRGRALWESGRKEEAVAEYREVTGRVSNEWAAQAAYETALYHFEQGDLDAAEAACFAFTREYPSYATWLVRTYLLLADVYLSRDDLFQARATLESILDNYHEKDEWRALAEARMAEIQALETEQSEIRGVDEEEPREMNDQD